MNECTFEGFEENLSAALPRLYDGGFQPGHVLWDLMGLDSAQGVGPLQSAIIHAIEDLSPAPDTPSGSILGRVYDILHRRFVLKLTQEQVAEHLEMSVRHLRRAQRDAVHLLARRLWEHSEAAGPPTGRAAASRMQREEAIDDGGLSLQWLSQVQEELASLRQSSPDARADVGESMLSATGVAAALTSQHDVSLDPRCAPYRIMVRMHPSALRQILVSAIAALAHGMSGGEIALLAERQGDLARILLSASPGTPVMDGDLSLVRQILADHGGSLDVLEDESATSLSIQLPGARVAEERVGVLVVDDNTDLVRSYQFYAAGTRYDLVHVDQGRRVFEAVEESSPDIIVLDIMLPDVDGWELLVQLHAHPATESIPVIVCSVVQEEELALALGATLFLPKPARRQQFTAALDQALSQAASRATGSLGNTPPAG